MIDLPLLGLLLGAGIVSALNPCSISLKIMVLSSIYGRGHSSGKLVLYGTLFLLGMWLAIIAAGYLVWLLFSILSPAVLSYIALVIALAAVIGGLIEIKDYFWYGRRFTLKIPKRLEASIHRLAIRMNNGPSFLVLGIYSAIVLLPYSSLTYLAILAILSINLPSFGLSTLSLYALIYTVPLLMLMVLSASKVRISALTKWKEEAKGAMRLTSGLLLVILGWILVLVVSGTVNFG
jgi:hypothetical protein